MTTSVLVNEIVDDTLDDSTDHTVVDIPELQHEIAQRMGDAAQTSQVVPDVQAQDRGKP